MPVVLRLFAGAREAAGTGMVELEGSTVAQVLDLARARFGSDFTVVLAASRVWLNGEPACLDKPVGGNDEIAVLPPISGG